MLDPDLQERLLRIEAALTVLVTHEAKLAAILQTQLQRDPQTIPERQAAVDALLQGHAVQLAQLIEATYQRLRAEHGPGPHGNGS